ncbi:hypothetical protein MTR_5g084650 [Medicago truncatula]|uniref:Uncharacterized protein n=1 Tax=Medicago truncatula TaxID=3880 RepID=G7K7F1_MEDTR|nr:hypothetical protein MTR_5g084650 [Medicago truncatula]
MKTFDTRSQSYFSLKGALIPLLGHKRNLPPEHHVRKTFDIRSRSYHLLNRALIPLLGHEGSPVDHPHLGEQEQPHK